MYIHQSRSILRMPVLCLFVAWAGSSQATTLAFSGQMDLIGTDTGTGGYAGASPGQLFSGVFSHGALADATTGPQFPGDCDFSTPPMAAR